MLDTKVGDTVIEKSWKPHLKQTEFIRVPFEVFEGLYGGSAGSGKSELLLLLPAIYGWVRIAGFKGIILRRTFPELESEIILRSHEFYKYMGGVYNESKKRWVWSWPDGEAYIQFGHAEHEEDIRKYDTAQYNYIAFDELTSFTKFQYLYLSLERGRSGVPGLPAIVRSATNPGNIGHGWVRKRFVEPCKEGGKIIEEDLGINPITGERASIYRIFIQALPTDNPHLLKNDPNYINRLLALPEAEKRAKLFGDWWTFSGQVFDEFRTEHFPKEPDNAYHLIDDEEFQIPDWYPRIISVDWGWNANTWMGWGAITPDSRIIGYREYLKPKKLITEYSADLLRLSEDEKIRGVILCHSAFQHRGEPKTIAEQFEEATGIAPINGGRNRVAGRLLAHEYLRWKQRPKTKLPFTNFSRETADRLLRNEGTKKYHDYLDMFIEQPPEENLPKWMQIKGKMPELEKVIPLCVFDKENSEDVAEFDGDDPYDGWRGLIKYANAYVTGLADELTIRNEKQQLYDELLRTGNQTSYYRKMETLESKSKEVYAVRRHGSVRRRH